LGSELYEVALTAFFDSMVVSAIAQELFVRASNPAVSMNVIARTKSSGNAAFIFLDFECGLVNSPPKCYNTLLKLCFACFFMIESRFPFLHVTDSNQIWLLQNMSEQEGAAGAADTMQIKGQMWAKYGPDGAVQ
jgi:hypothetical protein